MMIWFQFRFVFKVVSFRLFMPILFKNCLRALIKIVGEQICSVERANSRGTVLKRMVQCMSVSTLSRSSSVHGPDRVSRRKFRFSERGHVLFGVERHGFWGSFLHRRSLIDDVDLQKQQNFSVKAGWLFKGNDQESDASIERSDSAMEDIMIFFYQLDLGTRVQVDNHPTLLKTIWMKKSSFFSL